MSDYSDDYIDPNEEWERMTGEFFAEAEAIGTRLEDALKEETKQVAFFENTPILGFGEDELQLPKWQRFMKAAMEHYDAQYAFVRQMYADALANHVRTNTSLSLSVEQLAAELEWATWKMRVQMGKDAERQMNERSEANQAAHRARRGAAT
jgi:hypothetical protein